VRIGQGIGTVITWDLIVDENPLPGALNMAVDEFLFRSLGDKPRTFLRFYQWSKPTASLGYSQTVEKVLDLDSCHRNGVDVVRRITGGKLVLHHREITYSIASSDTEVFSSTLSESYRLISNALICGLGKMGLKAKLAGPPPASYRTGNLPCFSYPARDEIEVDGRKIVGSAQKRVGGHFLQHGSIPLQSGEDILKSISLGAEAKADLRMTSLSEVLGRSVDFEWAVDRLTEGISAYFNVRLRTKVFAPEEVAAITELRKARYDREAWTLGKWKGASLDFFQLE
jgi:lipoate-protein ligase A